MTCTFDREVSKKQSAKSSCDAFVPLGLLFETFFFLHFLPRLFSFEFDKCEVEIKSSTLGEIVLSTNTTRIIYVYPLEAKKCIERSRLSQCYFKRHRFSWTQLNNFHLTLLSKDQLFSKSQKALSWNSILIEDFCGSRESKSSSRRIRNEELPLLCPPLWS